MSAEGPYEGEAEGEEGEEDFIDLDLEKTLTWTGNAVIVQAGGEFRLPLIVPHPSVLAIQFEVDGGYDIEFSLLFKDDHENDYQVLVQPVRVSDREGQLDIDTTGVCELLWSNAHAWISSKTLSYQLQLAPKLDMQKQKWISAILSAANDFRLVSAAEAAESIDNAMRTLKQRTNSLQETLNGNKQKTAEAQTRYDRYVGHVKRLEDEVRAANRHVKQAANELGAAHTEAVQTQRSLVALQQIRTLDDGLTADVTETLAECDEPLTLIFEAYANCLYADDEGEEGDNKASSLDRAELLHFLQEFGLLTRGTPPDIMCGVFAGFGQQLSLIEYKRCIARCAIALAPDDVDGDKLRWLLSIIPERVETTKLIALDVKRRVKVLTAADELAHTLYEEDEE